MESGVPSVVSTLGDDTLDQKLMKYILNPKATYPTPVLNASKPTGDISKIFTTLTEIIYEANINGKLLNYGKLFLPERKE